MQARLHLPALAALAILAAASSASASPEGVRLAKVEHRSQAYVVAGRGSPALVMFTGLGNDMGTFDAVAGDLAADTTVLRIDRPGYGKSDPAPGGRDIDEVVSDYHSVVRQSGVAVPYVVLGHSLGGMYAEYYAARYPDEVAGIILEDSHPSDYTHRCLARLAADKCLPSDALIEQLPGTMQLEYARLEAVADAIGAIRPTGKLPVLVLTHGATKEGGAELGVIWRQSQDDLARKYPGAVHVVAPGSGHFIHIDAKPLFESAVRRFLADLRR